MLGNTNPRVSLTTAELTTKIYTDKVNDKSTVIKVSVAKLIDSNILRYHVLSLLKLFFILYYGKRIKGVLKNIVAVI